MMHTANTWPSEGRAWTERARTAAERARDWLDSRGRGAWIAAMVIGFVLFWPVGLAILFYMIWSKRMSCNSMTRHRNASRHRDAGATGNAAFDAYRSETLRRLEDEREQFTKFLDKLREAKDQAEFDQFMSNRRTGDQPAD